MEWDGSCDLLNAGPVLFGPVITTFKYTIIIALAMVPRLNSSPQVCL